MIPHLKEHKLMKHYKQVAARNGKSGLSTARMILRKMRLMVRGNTIYFPDETLTSDELKIYVSTTFEKMKHTLKHLDLSAIESENNCITQMEDEWKAILKSL